MEPIRIAHNVNLETKYGDSQADIWLSKYQADNSYALVATYVDDRSRPLLTLTKCLVDYRQTPVAGYVWIPDYSEYVGVQDALQKLGIVAAPLKCFGGDHGVRFWLCELLKTEEV